MGWSKSAQANLDRLRVLEQYKRIVAPFDGLVTVRSTDIGALINAGAAGGPALFVVSDTNKLRVYVNVPQSYVPSIQDRHQGEYLGARISGKGLSGDRASVRAGRRCRVRHHADAALVDNAGGQLMTGDFTNVSFELPHPEIAINVPASALIFDQGGLFVATVSGDMSRPSQAGHDLARSRQGSRNRIGPQRRRTGDREPA